ncbi:MAG: hypothetical protein QME42_03255 [bacterium]|nr:hypothetical protein [bacterium]
MDKSFYEIFERKNLKILPLSQRQSDIKVDSFLELNELPLKYENPKLDKLIERIVRARENKSQVILMMGAHVIRSGVSRYIIDLMEKGFITHIAMNGAGPIHEFELARIGKTTESVARYIKEGQFGLWKETGELNDVIVSVYKEKLGLGEGVGRFIEESKYPYKNLSILSAGFRCRIPVTVHVGIGYDILHEHPNCDGAAIGETSYRDFLIFARSIQSLEGGVLLCFGSAVMGPEVFLKALAMARNIAHQSGKEIRHFTTAVFDLIDIEEDYHKELPTSTPMYYYRPWKTLLVRTVVDGGESFYFQGQHRTTIPSLYHLLIKVSLIITEERRQ